MGDQIPKNEIKSIEASGDNNEGRYLTPIEEETESMISSRKTLGDYSESEAEDYVEETYKNKFITDKDDDNDNVINGKTQIGPRRKSLEMTIELLKNKVSNSEKEIAALKKQLSLEKFRGYEFLLRCREKNLKANMLLKVELEDWKDIVVKKIQNQMIEWQLIEQKRIKEEITKISKIYSQEIWRTLKSNIEKWRTEDAERANEVIQERCRQEIEAEGIQRIYGMIQVHMESLEKRNKKAYDTFHKQIDTWEQHLKEMLVKLHEDDLKKLRHQVKVWYEEQDKDRYDTGASKKSGRNERQEETEIQRTSKEASEERRLKRLRESNREDVCRIEENLKTQLQAYQQESTKKMNDKISELWIAFEQFKHNFSLNYEYQSGIRNNYIGRVVIDNDVSFVGSKVVGDFIDKNVQKSRTTIDARITKDENEEGKLRRQGKKKSKHVSFEIPILPQVPDESFTRK